MPGLVNCGTGSRVRAKSGNSGWIVTTAWGQASRDELDDGGKALYHSSQRRGGRETG